MQGVLATSLVVDKKCCVGRKSEEVFHENVDMKLKSVSIVEHAPAGSRQSGAQVIAISEQAGLDVTGHHVVGLRQSGAGVPSKLLETERIVLLCIMEFCCSW